MQATTSKVSGRDAALAMIAQVERQATGISKRYAGGTGITDRYADFQTFIGQLGEFQLFIDMVENRLGAFEPEKQVAQAKNLAVIRWGMLQMEVEASSIFLDRMIASGKPWPMGSQPFLRRRLSRLDDISSFHTDHVTQYQLTAPNAAMMQKIRDQIGQQIDSSLALNDFSIASAPSAFTPAPLQAEPVRRPAPKPKAPPPPVAKRVMRLQVREADGYSYIAEDGLAVITEACKVANTSIDEFAKALELSRPGLVLILNGRDPCSTALLKTLRRLVVRAGGVV
ncbi:hypothetical protein [Ferrovibrio terrae]|uniref:hypothetical protein n=1 Tax=Ferrovibrio terrae TaxID=2594003 RepID=UPI00313780A1